MCVLAMAVHQDENYDEFVDSDFFSLGIDYCHEFLPWMLLFGAINLHYEARNP